jgi:hypothetical protein
MILLLVDLPFFGSTSILQNDPQLEGQFADSCGAPVYLRFR